VIVAFVTGGVPDTDVVDWATPSRYGVIVYFVGAPPDDGALHVKLAEPVPAVPDTPETCPGAAVGCGANSRSTQ
jgi:hypothetical protein